MLFNSLAFLLFFPAFLLAYVPTRGRARLWVCVVASYVFYGWWDWRFVPLLFLSTSVDFFIARWMAAQQDPSRRRQLLVLSLVVNLGVLGFFKYTGFFVDTVAASFLALGLHVSHPALAVALPIGISFYTFHSLSYTIDVYRREMEPEPSLLRYSAFVALFPHLVAGPIVRAHAILPQLRQDRAMTRERWSSGACLVAWGFFKKIVVADNLAQLVDPCFADPRSFGGLNLATAVLAYAFQIYADFSGYSDIAIGIARMIGFDFPLNFARPYFAAGFADFWRRWHVSLSTWLRDYLYIPLGGSRGSGPALYRNLMITMVLGGLWHGASWTFVAWGLLHGLYLVAGRLLAAPWSFLVRAARVPGWAQRAVLVPVTFALTCFAWIFFRARSFGLAAGVLRGLASPQGWDFASLGQKFAVGRGLLVVLVLLAVDLVAERGEFVAGRANVAGVSPVRAGAGSILGRRPVLRLALMAATLWCLALLGAFGGARFIYFQF